MLYGNESISTYTPSNVAVWLVMAFQAGVINIGGYLACHNFVSHLTGLATLFGNEVSQFNYSHALGMAAVPVLFLVGAMISASLVDIRLRLKKKPKYYIIFGFMFLLIAGVEVVGFNGVFGEFGEPLMRPRDYVLMALLCMICGMQNGTITSVSRAVVRTTHLTGIVTDLGIGIVRVLNRDKVEDRAFEDVRANYMRLGLITCFVFGSVFGGLLFPRSGFRGFLLPTFISGALFAVTFYFQVLTASKKRN